MKKTMRYYTAVVSVLVSLFFLAACEIESPYVDSIEERINTDIEIENGYSVIYHANGADSGEVPVDANKYKEGMIVTVKNSGTLALSNSTFIGWNTETNGTGENYIVDSTFTMPGSQVNLYAQWTTNQTYTVTYIATNSDGGSAPTDENNYEEGDVVNIYGTGTMTRTGYSFSRWDTQEDGNGIPRIPGNSFTMGSGDVTLYAQWTVNTYTVTFNKQGGTGGDNSVSVTYEAPMPDASKPSRTGYSFGGYYSNIDGSGNQYYTASMESSRNWDIGNNATLYAKWTGNPYTVTLDKQSGTGGDSSIGVVYGSPLPSASPPTRTGYTFNGYYSGTSGTGTQYYTASMESSRNWDIIGNATLYAQWQINTYTVTFNKNDAGAVGSMPDQGIVYNGTENLNACAFTKTGWSFAGWATSPGGSVSYVDQASYTIGSSNATLYARWTAPGVYALGDRGPAGGWIFYDKGTYDGGWRYMEEGPVDLQGTLSNVWGTSNFSVTGADGTEIGDGLQNTLDIVTNDTGTSNKAADLCYSYTMTNGGVTYDNWFLPSLKELREMYTQFSTNGYGNFQYYYWSSTELSATSAGSKSFSNGTEYYPLKDERKRVRAVRRF